MPSRAMLTNCRPHLLREFGLLAPEIVIPVGGLSIKELLGIRRLSEAVGETYGHDGVVYVPLPHPAGGFDVVERTGEQRSPHSRARGVGRHGRRE